MQRRFSADEKKNILWQLTAAEGLERYLHTKYVGQKRFSLEGGDSLIPLLDELVQQGGSAGIEETIIGMAHRGRLNVLVNLLGKSPKDLFSEFEGHYDPRPIARLGRRQVSQGIFGGPQDRLRQRARRARLQSLAPRDRQCGGRGLGARAPGAPRRPQGRQGAGGADSRRRGVRRAGRHHGDAAAVAGARLLHRRHDPHHHQQPGRLHHQRSARCALDAVLLRRGEDGARRRSSTSMRTIRRRCASSRDSRSTTA